MHFLFSLIRPHLNSPAALKLFPRSPDDPKSFPISALWMREREREREGGMRGKNVKSSGHVRFPPRVGNISRKQGTKTNEVAVSYPCMHANLGCLSSFVFWGPAYKLMPRLGRRSGFGNSPRPQTISFMFNAFLNWLDSGLPYSQLLSPTELNSRANIMLTCTRTNSL